MDGVGEFGDAPVGRQMQDRSGDGRSQIEHAGCREIHAAGAVGGEVVGSDEGLAAGIPRQHPDLVALLIEFDEGV